MNRSLSLLLFALALLLTAGLAFWAGSRSPLTGRTAVPTGPSKGSTSGQVLYWYDTMVPDQHFDKPGLSPMGMQMVPKYADSAGTKGGVRIDPATVQNLGVRIAPVERRVLGDDIQVPGTITWDLSLATTVSARVDAVIAKLDVRAAYTTVAAGAPLAELLAPQWSSAVAEFQALQHARSTDAQALRGAAQQRLQLLGLSPADIQTMGRGGGITMHALQGGVVTSLDVREGQRVNAGQTLMTINGLATVWIEANLPQAVAGIVHAGTPADIRVDALPGRVFQGRVETLLPDIDAATRTQRARIVLANSDGSLSPGMFVRVQLAPVAGEAVPVVPDDALITTGVQSRVIVADGAGHFQPVAVRTGRSAGGYTAILEGLHGDEKVVVSGQFLIDSEASLSGALDRLGTSPSAPVPAKSAPSPATSSAMPMGEKR